jgi:hypothetical protein
MFGMAPTFSPAETQENFVKGFPQIVCDQPIQAVEELPTGRGRYGVAGFCTRRIAALLPSDQAMAAASPLPVDRPDAYGLPLSSR